MNARPHFEDISELEETVKILYEAFESKGPLYQLVGKLPADVSALIISHLSELGNTTKQVQAAVEESRKIFEIFVKANYSHLNNTSYPKYPHDTVRDAAIKLYVHMKLTIENSKIDITSAIEHLQKAISCLAATPVPMDLSHTRNSTLDASYHIGEASTFGIQFQLMVIEASSKLEQFRRNLSTWKEDYFYLFEKSTSLNKKIC